MSKPDQIKTAAAAWAHHEFGTEYRGYKFMGLNWATIGNQFAIYAFMPNSPLHPLDMMKQTGEPDEIDMTVNVHIENALCGLRRLIDHAWDAPETFRPTAVVVGQ